MFPRNLFLFYLSIYILYIYCILVLSYKFQFFPMIMSLIQIYVFRLPTHCAEISEIEIYTTLCFNVPATQDFRIIIIRKCLPSVPINAN